MFESTSEGSFIDKKMDAFDVFLPGRCFPMDRVYYDASITESEVKTSLIEHDGYPWNIRVVRG